MFDTYVGASAGVYRLKDGSGPQPLGLEGERVSALHARNEGGRTTLLAGTYEHGLHCSDDGGRGWHRVEEGFTAPCVRCIAPDPLDSGALLAGAEPARLFRSRDGGRSWRELDGIRRI